MHNEYTDLKETNVITLRKAYITLVCCIPESGITVSVNYRCKYIALL